MITSEEFRIRLIAGKTDELLDEVLLAAGAKHVDQSEINFIQTKISNRFVVAKETVEVVITGSAKIGFSLVEKKINNTYYPRYRPFCAKSDIDVAIVSPKLFEIIWRELTKHAHRSATIPWDSRRLGDYMVYGWLRPDHFPNNVRLRKCDAWWDEFRKFSASPRFQRHNVRGGLFHSRDQLRMYMMRSINECLNSEELSK